MVAAIVGFFASAGAAGVDICTSNRDENDVKMGGIVGVIIAIIFQFLSVKCGTDPLPDSFL